MTENNMTFGELLAEWVPTTESTHEKSSYEDIVRDAEFLSDDIGSMLITDMTTEFIADYFEKLDTRSYTVGYAIAKKNAKMTLLRNGYSREILRKEMGILSSTLSFVYNGSKIARKWAIKFSEQLNIPYEELFDDYSEEKTYARGTMQATKSVVRRALGYAKAKGYIDENYARLHFVRCPKIERIPAKTPTEQEMQKVFSTALIYPDIRVRAATLLLFAFGFNRLEVHSLDWSCFDFENNAISSQTRTVTVPPVIMAILKDYQAWQKEKEPFNNPYIFRKTNGEKIHDGTLKGWFRKVLKRADLQDYDLKGFQLSDFDYRSMSVVEIPKIETVGKEQYYVDPMRKEMRSLGFKTYNEYLEYLEFLSAVDAHAKKHKKEMI